MKDNIKYRINFYYPDHKTIDDYEEFEGTEKQALARLAKHKEKYGYPSIRLFKVTTKYEEVKK